MKRFTITDVEWKEFPMHPEKFDGYQLSLKCKVVFEEPIERNEGLKLSLKKDKIISKKII